MLSGVTTVSAQEPPTENSPAEIPLIKVTSDSPFLLLVDGIPAELPTSIVRPGTQVCVEDALRYVSQRDRWVFQRWSHGPEDQCVTLTEPGGYRAIFEHQFVLHIRSAVIGMKVSSWVIDGERVEVEVPETVQEGERSRYRFLDWGEGESPFTAKNIVAPLEPMDLEPTWVREHFVKIEGPENVVMEGSGWYSDGVTLPLRAPKTVPLDTEGARLQFDSWQSVGVPFVAVPEPEEAVGPVTVLGPYTLRATYNNQFLVVAQSPFGVLKREWVDEGLGVELEAPAVQETVPGEQRLVFSRWIGQEGLLSPRILNQSQGGNYILERWQRHGRCKHQCVGSGL